MSTHLAAIGHETGMSAPTHPDVCGFPEQRWPTIVCTVPQPGNAWPECRQILFGARSAACGAHDCHCRRGRTHCLGLDDRPPHSSRDQREFEFHGVMHPSRDGSTVPLLGCAGAAGDATSPEAVGETLFGTWDVNDGWHDDTSCHLELTITAHTASAA